MSIIDAHMHVWQLARGDYGWLTPELGPIYRDFGIDDIWVSAERKNVSGAILVQAAPTVAENDFLLNLADTDPRILGVVGWVDFEDPAASNTLQDLNQNRHFVGLRPMIADRDEPDWILNPRFSNLFRTAQREGLVFDLLNEPRHLESSIVLARKYPGLRFMLDHGGKPDIKSEDYKEWSSDIAELSRHKNVYCKLSGLLTEAGSRTDDDSLVEVVETLFSSFGEDRILWGSDWPVLTLASDYCQWLDQARRLTARCAPGSEHKVFYENARTIYGLKDA